MPQKTPINLAAWQWALIGSGCTLLLSSAAYGVSNLISNSQGSGAISKNSPIQSKSSDANISPPASNYSDGNISPSASNTSDKVVQNFSNIPIAGTWLIKTIPDNKTIEVVVTNDGRVIVPDPTNASRAIEGATNIRRISSNTNATSSGFIASIAGTWLFEMQETTPNNEPIQAIISIDGIRPLAELKINPEQRKF